MTLRPATLLLALAMSACATPSPVAVQCPAYPTPPKALAPSGGEPRRARPPYWTLDEIEERVLAVLAEGDAEIAKYVELYRLEQANAAIRASQ
jgi:hypothetical protein